MKVPRCSILALGHLTPWGKEFLTALKRENTIEPSFEADIEKFFHTRPTNNQLILVIENVPESQGWIKRIREKGYRFYILWFGRSFTKEDMAFAMKFRVYAVLDSLNPEDSEASEAIARLANLVEDDKRFGTLIHSMRETLLKLQGDVPVSLLSEMKSAVEKVGEYGVLNEMGVGANASTKRGDTKLILPEAEEISDALTTVDILERTGVLWVKTKIADQEGQVDFIQGKIVSARTGEVTGLKALYRMYLWESPSFVFTYREPRSFVVREDLNLSVRAICMQGQNLRNRFQAMKRELPPSDVELGVDITRIHSGVALTYEDFHTLASVVEFKRVSTILDYTNIPDVDLYESLIRLRKNKLIQVAA